MTLCDCLICRMDRGDEEAARECEKLQEYVLRQNDADDLILIWRAALWDKAITQEEYDENVKKVIAWRDAVH